MNTTTWHDQRPTHPVIKESTRLTMAAQKYDRLFSMTIDTDPEVAEQYYQTALILKDRANQLSTHEHIEALQAWYNEHADNEPQNLRTFLL